MSSELDRLAEIWIEDLGVRGFRIAIQRVLANGIQAEVTGPASSCRVNLYLSTKRGFSTVYAGGDRDLFGSLVMPPGRRGITGGSDEAGKGDYFGPLVAASVALDPDSAARLTAMGLVDSKLLDARRIFKLEEAIRVEASAHCVRSIQPPDYNDAMESMPRGRNSLDILTGLHSGAIRGMIDAEGVAKPERIVIDKFCAEQRLRPLLPDGFRYEFRTRAEEEPAVAAASVLARAAYLRALLDLGAVFGTGLKSGAGSDIDRIGAEAVRKLGPDVLRQIGKIHFINTGRMLRLAGY